MLVLGHLYGVMGSNAAATRRPSSANRLYVEHALRYRNVGSASESIKNGKTHGIHDVQLYP
jgi:hypothetical protein